MDKTQLLALAFVAFPACFSPGMNNALVAASAARFGMRRTVPHILGIVLGFPFMLFVVGLVLAETFRQSPLLQQGIKLIGCALLLWLAVKIARSGGLTTPAGRPRPFTLPEAAAFQWVNPKAWTLAVSVTAQFVSPSAPVLSSATVAVMFGLAVLGSNLTWGTLGQSLKNLGLAGNRLRWLNYGLAALLVGTVLILLTT